MYAGAPELPHFGGPLLEEIEHGKLITQRANTQPRPILGLSRPVLPCNIMHVRCLSEAR